MSFEGNHRDAGAPAPAASPPPPAAAPAPGHRPTGAVPTASRAFAGDLAGAWWYTWTGFILCVLVVVGFASLAPLQLLAAHLEHGRTAPASALAAMLLFQVLAVAGQIRTARLFRAPPPETTDRPLPGRTDLLWLFGPTVPPALAAAVLPLFGLHRLGTWWALSLWLSALVLSQLLPPPRARRALLLGGAVTLVLGAAAVFQDPQGPQDTGPGFLVWGVLTAGMIIPTVWFWRLMQRLDHARGQAAELAVARERLRFAADLHDVQGHHLQVISLKAELAERLLTKGRAEDAGAQVHEVREQAREALAETRALVRDLREVSAERELANARDVLTAAGTAAEVHVDPDLGPLGPAAGRLVGLAAREATTNILRHACAGHARLELTGIGPTAVRLVVRNDGAPAPRLSLPVTGSPALDSSAAGTPDADPTTEASRPEQGERPSSGSAAGGRRGGTGLTALAERAEAAGGTLSTTQEGETFTLTLTVPRSADQETA